VRGRPLFSFTFAMGPNAADREAAVWGAPGDYRIASRSVGEPWFFR